MQVCKTFAKIAKKKLAYTITYFIVFIVLIIAMSFQADSSSGKQFEVSSVNLCIIDKDESEASQALCDYLSSMHHRVTYDSYDRESLQDNLYYGQISYALTIPAGFEKQLSDGNYENLVQTSKLGDNASGYFVDNQIDAYLHSLSMYLETGTSVSDAIACTDHSLQLVPEVKNVSFTESSNSQSSIMYYFFQYLPYIALMLLMCGLAPVLMEFHKEKLDARIQCGAISRLSISMQLGICCIIYVFFLWLIMIAVAAAITSPAQIFSENGRYCLLNSGVYMLIAAAFALILGAFPVERNVIDIVSNILGLGMSFLCGIFVPMSFLGDNVLRFSRFLPAYWYMKTLNMLSPLSDDAFSATNYWMYLGIELLFFAVLFSIYLALSHRSNTQKK